MRKQEYGKMRYVMLQVKQMSKAGRDKMRVWKGLVSAYSMPEEAEVMLSIRKEVKNVNKEIRVLEAIS